MKGPDSSSEPISCTLSGSGLRERLTAIAALTRDALQGFQRRGLVLDLKESYGATGFVT
jgi:hypothetical protein